MKKFRLIQYRENCIGCNACVEAAPDRWRMSKKDGKCTLIGGTEKKGIYTSIIQDFEIQENRLAAANCPVNIIKIVELG